MAIADPPSRIEALAHGGRALADPAIFLREFGRVLDPLRGEIPFEMWPHLEDLLTTWQSERLCIVLKARQLGVSWLLAGYALWTALSQEGANVLMLSKRQDEATALLAKSKYLLEQLPFGVRVGKSNDSTLEILSNRSKVSALPSTPSAGRSESATLLLLDEYAFFEYAEENYAAVKPTIDAGGRLIAVSTANGLGGHFYSLWSHAPENGFTRIFLPWSARPGRTTDWYAQQQKEYPAHLLAQEYPDDPSQAFIQSGRAVFQDGLVLDGDLVAESPPDALRGLVGLTFYFLPEPNEHVIIGADVAQGLISGDASAATVLVQEAPNRWREAASLHGRWPPDVFAHSLHTLAQVYGGVLGVERNNHGHAVLQKLRELAPAKYTLYHELAVLKTPTSTETPTSVGQYGWNTTSASKPTMIAELDEALRHEWIGLGTAATLDELRSYQRLDNGDTSAVQGGYDDRVISLAIAWQMRKTPPRRAPRAGLSPLVGRHA